MCGRNIIAEFIAENHETITEYIGETATEHVCETNTRHFDMLLKSSKMILAKNVWLKLNRNISMTLARDTLVYFPVTKAVIRFEHLPGDLPRQIGITPATRTDVITPGYIPEDTPGTSQGHIADSTT